MTGIRSECLYQLALISLKLGQYSAAKKHSEALLNLVRSLFMIYTMISQEPNNISALSLRSLVIDRTVHGQFT